MNEEFWQSFYKMPLDKVPWQNTQADWFQELLEKKRVRGTSALDLGCGTGMKSITLAQSGFTRVIGVDIAPRAIVYAKENARKNNVEVEFVVHDATDLRFLKDEKFDFILDWAHLHCIPKERVETYVYQIQERSKKDTLLLIRVFNTREDKDYFEEKVDQTTSKIFFYRKAEILRLLSGWTMIAEHESQPMTKSNMYFTELLLKKE